MSLDKLRRVIWRLREKFPGKNQKILNFELRKAICEEIGTNIITYRNNRKDLITLRMIKPIRSKYIKIISDIINDDEEVSPQTPFPERVTADEDEDMPEEQHQPHSGVWMA